MIMKRCNISLLLSPLFLFSLFVLGLNDWVLKATFHNFLTGKLSDFAGLFALAIFILAWLPIQKQHYQQGVLWAIALFFSWWKSPFSADFITWWSSCIFPIHRVIDITDLFALIVLPFAAYYSTNYKAIYLPKISHYFVSFVACMLFMATSYNDWTDVKIPKLYIVTNKIIDSLKTTDSLTYIYKFEPDYSSEITVFAIDSMLSCIRLNHINKKSILHDDYEQNVIIAEFENQKIKPFLDKQKLPCNYFQLDSNQQKINQTDPKGRKQGNWKFFDGNFSYNVTYKDDILNGNYIITKNYTDTIMKGQFVNNVVEGMWSFYDRTAIVREKRLYEQGETRKIFVDKEETNVDTRQILKNKVSWGLLFDTFILITACAFFIKICWQTPKQNDRETIWIDGFIFIFLTPFTMILLYLVGLKPNDALEYFTKSLRADAPFDIVGFSFFGVILSVLLWIIVYRYFTYKLLFWWVLTYLFFLITWNHFFYWIAL